MPLRTVRLKNMWPTRYRRSLKVCDVLRAALAASPDNNVPAGVVFSASVSESDGTRWVGTLSRWLISCAYGSPENSQANTKAKKSSDRIVRSRQYRSRSLLLPNENIFVKLSRFDSPMWMWSPGLARTDLGDKFSANYRRGEAHRRFLLLDRRTRCTGIAPSVCHCLLL